MNRIKNITGITLVAVAAGFLAMGAPATAFAAGGCQAPHKASKPTTADNGGTTVIQEASDKKGERTGKL